MTAFQPSVCRIACTVVVLLAMLTFSRTAAQADDSLSDTVAGIQPKMVKIYGSGGLMGLEGYQSGFVISPDGFVLTVWSYVLDAEDFINVVLDDGRRFEAKLMGHDPRLEIALLKIDAVDLPFFDLSQSRPLEVGEGVLAFSNLYGVATGNEPASVLFGRVSAVTDLSARRGTYKTLYNGPVYVLDAMTNNPGAAGGALTDVRGQLAGLLGKELRNSLNNTWLNYSIPIDQLTVSVRDMLDGKSPALRDDETAIRPATPMTLDLLGVVLLPDFLPKTPPYVDQIRPGSAADRAGMRSDDLILFVNDAIASSAADLRDELSFIDRIDSVRFTVQRGQELLEFELTIDNDRQ